MVDLSNEVLEEMLKKLMLIRKFEEKVNEMFMQGKIHGTTHLGIGQEACAVGAIQTLREDDYIVSNHRGHGHCIAKGASIDRMMAELFGRESGFCKGLGGSMHIVDVDTNNLGANGIVGGGIAIAVGAALALKKKKSDNVVLNVFAVYDVVKQAVERARNGEGPSLIERLFEGVWGRKNHGYPHFGSRVHRRCGWCGNNGNEAGGRTDVF